MKTVAAPASNLAISSSDAARAGAAENAAIVVDTARTTAMNLRDMVGFLSLSKPAMACYGRGIGPLPVTSISVEQAKTGNIGVALSDSSTGVIEFHPCSPQVVDMKIILPFLVIAVLCMPAAAQAACYADYKAKQDAPLRLHYGVAKISGDCTPASADRELQARLAQAGWTLLNVVSVFDENGLAERKESAGPHFLRY